MFSFSDVDILGLGDEGGLWDQLFTNDEAIEADAATQQAEIYANASQQEALINAEQSQNTIIIISIIAGTVLLIAGLYFVFK